jgi:hypothetical protein
LVTGTMRCGQPGLIPTKCVCRDRQKIIKKLQRMRDRNLPLYANYILRNHEALFSNSRREFGSWSNALRAAGIAKQVPKNLYKCRLGTLRSLRDVVETRPRTAIPPVLKSQAVYYFGSLRNALAALKHKIITTLRGMHRAKESLSSWKARCETPALASAARTYFGSWRNALHATGFDPNRHIKALQAAQAEYEQCYLKSCQRETIVVHTYTEAVTVSPRVASKRRLCLSANIRNSSRHAKALL